MSKLVHVSHELKLRLPVANKLAQQHSHHGREQVSHTNGTRLHGDRLRHLFDVVQSSRIWRCKDTFTSRRHVYIYVFCKSLTSFDLMRTCADTCWHLPLDGVRVTAQGQLRSRRGRHASHHMLSTLQRCCEARKPATSPLSSPS
jgi:hypothetical protein